MSTQQGIQFWTKSFIYHHKDNLAAQSTSNRQGRGDVLEGDQAKRSFRTLKK
jgi:thymidylate synthase (FAD)